MISGASLIVMAGTSLVLGVWDLVKRPAKDVLAGVGLVEVGLVGGAVAQGVMPGGFIVGLVAGVAVGGWWLMRTLTRRTEGMERALHKAPDDASRMLMLHDRLDALALTGRPVQRVLAIGAVTLILASAAGLLLMGIVYDDERILALGAAMLFLPLGQIARALIEREERTMLVAELRGPLEAPEIPPSKSDRP